MQQIVERPEIGKGINWYITARIPYGREVMKELADLDQSGDGVIPGAPEDHGALPAVSLHSAQGIFQGHHQRILERAGDVDHAVVAAAQHGIGPGCRVGGDQLLEHRAGGLADCLDGGAEGHAGDIGIQRDQQAVQGRDLLDREVSEYRAAAEAAEYRIDDDFGGR